MHKFCLIKRSLVLALIFEKTQTIEESLANILHLSRTIITDMPVRKSIIFLQPSRSKEVSFSIAITFSWNMLTRKSIYTVERLCAKNCFPMSILNMKNISNSDKRTVILNNMITKLCFRVLFTSKITHFLVIEIINRNHVCLILEILWNLEKYWRYNPHPTWYQKKYNQKPISLFEKKPKKSEKKISFLHRSMLGQKLPIQPYQ